jgi:hypothetical protein
MIAIGSLGFLIGVETYFAAYRDCEALPLDDVCRVRHIKSCFPSATTPSNPIPNAGVVTLTDGIATSTATPDELGLYTSAPARLDISRTLKVVAAGGTVPAFEAEFVYPSGSLTIEAPTRSSPISRSAPLTVSWSGAASAQFAGIAIVNGDVGGKYVECQPPPTPTAFEVGAQFTAMLQAGKSTRITVAPVNAQRLTVGDWIIDVVATWPGSGYPVEVVP